MIIMRIVHIVSTYPPYAGGMGNVCFNEAQELQKFGHKVVVFTPQYKKKGHEDKKQDSDVVFLKPLIQWGNAALAPSVVKELKDFDIVHLHWPFIGGAETVLFFKLFTKFKPKLVVQYHMDLIGPGLRGLLFYIYKLLFNPILVRTADVILASSFDYIRNSNLRKYISQYSNKFIEFPLGVDINEFSPQPKNIKLLEKYNLLVSDKIILFVGGLDRAHYFKGLGVLLRALSSYKLQATNYKLIIVGEGELKQEYQKMAQELEVGDKVVFTGRVSNKDLPSYYNLADVFVLPSTSSSEAFGLVLLEAMACAKPIIVSNLPGPRTLVKNNGLIVKVNNTKDLTEKLALILNNQAMAQKFGQEGRKLVEEKYSWHKAGERLNQIYHNLL